MRKYIIASILAFVLSAAPQAFAQLVPPSSQWSPGGWSPLGGPQLPGNSPSTSTSPPSADSHGAGSHSPHAPTTYGSTTSSNQNPHSLPAQYDYRLSCPAISTNTTINACRQLTSRPTSSSAPY